MNGTLGNYLAQLGGYSQTPGSATNPNATPTKPMNEWGMEDYMQFMAQRPSGTGAAGGGGGTGNLGKAMMAGMNIGGGAAGAAGGAGLLASL